MRVRTRTGTISLAVEYNTVVMVWIGTTLGMLASNAFGIGVGIETNRKAGHGICLVAGHAAP